jgi:RNA polymerase sigma-70 factor (ECF subfamily)
MTASLDDLLAQLCSGDTAAAGETYRYFERYLRTVVRRNLAPGLRAKFDSEDVVQSVWATLLHGFQQGEWRFPDVDHLRAFLVKATRNRFLDRVRQHGRFVERELPLTDLEPDEMPHARDARPSQLAEGEDLWQQVLALCPPEHLELVRLKREGVDLDEIARRLGLHRDSVRRVLRQLARRVAFRQSGQGSNHRGTQNHAEQDHEEDVKGGL